MPPRAVTHTGAGPTPDDKISHAGTLINSEVDNRRTGIHPAPAIATEPGIEYKARIARLPGRKIVAQLPIAGNQAKTIAGAPSTAPARVKAPEIRASVARLAVPAHRAREAAAALQRRVPPVAEAVADEGVEAEHASDRIANVCLTRNSAWLIASAAQL